MCLMVRFTRFRNYYQKILKYYSEMDYVFVHDIFNIISLSLVVALDFTYLWRSTKFDRIGTASLGRFTNIVTFLNI